MIYIRLYTYITKWTVHESHLSQISASQIPSAHRAKMRETQLELRSQKK